MDRKLCSFLAFLPLCAVASLVLTTVPFTQAAEGLPGATVRPESAKSMEERCRADPEKCREMREKMKARQEQCKADPEKCRAEMQARQTERFKRADANNDGKLTREEARKGMPGVARNFDQIDTNKDGFLSPDELKAARMAHRAAAVGK